MSIADRVSDYFSRKADSDERGYGEDYLKQCDVLANDAMVEAYDRLKKYFKQTMSNHVKSPQTMDVYSFSFAGRTLYENVPVVCSGDLNALFGDEDDADTLVDVLREDDALGSYEDLGKWYADNHHDESAAGRFADDEQGVIDEMVQHVLDSDVLEQRHSGW